MQPPQRELRILHVITRLIVGGAQEHALQTIIGQQHTPGMKVTLITGHDFGPEGTLEDKAKEAGVDMQFLPEMVRPIAPATDTLALAKLTAFIRRGRFDVVHTHTSKAGIVGRLAARAANTPIIVHTLHGLIMGAHAKPWENLLYTRLERICASVCHRILDVSQATRQGALSHGIGTPDKYRTIYSGFNIAPFLDIATRVSVAQAKQRLGFSPDHLVIGKVGRLFEKKGHEYMIEAAKEISRHCDRARFMFVGDGNLRAQYEADVARAGLSDRFLFTGVLPPEQMPEVMQAMDILAHTSHREGLARVIPQAQAVGKPVVSFALDGSFDVIEDGVSGFLTKPHDAADVAKRVLEIIYDAPRREQMGLIGRKFAAENFSTELMVKRTNEVYYELAAERLAQHAA
ncbi:MAG: glycosyltransferase family 4 protein [Polyangiaceae bacterium]